MDTILHLLSKFLSPEYPETGGIYVGDLIIHLLRKASTAIGPILPDLLQALVVRLATAKLQSFIEVRSLSRGLPWSPVAVICCMLSES